MPAASTAGGTFFASAKFEIHSCRQANGGIFLIWERKPSHGSNQAEVHLPMPTADLGYTMRGAKESRKPTSLSQSGVASRSSSTALARIEKAVGYANWKVFSSELGDLQRLRGSVKAASASRLRASVVGMEKVTDQRQASGGEDKGPGASAPGPQWYCE